MGWVTLIKEENIRFFSMADSIEIIHDYFFEFWLNMTPGMLFFIVISFLTLLVAGLIFSISMAIRKNRVTI